MHNRMSLPILAQTTDVDFFYAHPGHTELSNPSWGETLKKVITHALDYHLVLNSQNQCVLQEKSMCAALNAFRWDGWLLFLDGPSVQHLFVLWEEHMHQVTVPQLEPCGNYCPNPPYS